MHIDYLLYNLHRHVSPGPPTRPSARGHRGNNVALPKSVMSDTLHACEETKDDGAAVESQ